MAGAGGAATAALPLGGLLGLGGCLLNACAYVGLLYIWKGRLPRDHPPTIKRRIASTLLACALAWLPVYFSARHHGVVGLGGGGLR